jgi:uncharacterized protein (TIGR02996 family)
LLSRSFLKDGNGVTDGEALIRSVLANPADDAPRLVYADWLEERGRAEDAEFIRVQIELARLGFDGAFHVDSQGRLQRMPAHIERLQERQLELWMGGAGRPELHKELANWPMTIHPMRGQSLRIRRGFVERVASFAEIFIAVAAGLFRHQPVTRISLVDRQPFHTGSGYGWARKVGRDTFGSVPTILWPYLSAGDGPVEFPTADEAEAALSRACVQYGRTAAGLANGSEVGQ